jgi:hypothetical protein
MLFNIFAICLKITEKNFSFPFMSLYYSQFQLYFNHPMNSSIFLVCFKFHYNVSSAHLYVFFSPDHSLHLVIFFDYNINLPFVQAYLEHTKYDKSFKKIYTLCGKPFQKI